MTIATNTQQLLVNHQLLTPTEPLQYRAIGRLWGKYIPQPDKFYQGQLITGDGVILDAVVRDKTFKRLRYHIDLSLDYLWTVYPRTPLEETGIGLKVSLIGVTKPVKYTDAVKTELQLLADTFSVQGLVVYQDFEQGIVQVKIHRLPRSYNENPNDFKLRLNGFLPPKSMKKFWNFYVRRVGTSLVIQSGECIKLEPREPSSTDDISTKTAEDTTDITES